METVYYDSLQTFDELCERFDAENGVLNEIEGALKRRETALFHVLENMETERKTVVAFDEKGNSTLCKTKKLSDLFRAFRWQRFACKIVDGDLIIELHDFTASRRLVLRELAPGVFQQKRGIAFDDALPLGKVFKQTIKHSKEIGNE